MNETKVKGIKMKFSFANAVKNSKILTYTISPDNMQRHWTRSIIFDVLDSVLNWPLSLLKKIYGKLENVFENSISVRILRFFTDRLHIIMALALAASLLIPYHKWYNKYGVFMVAIIFVLFIFRVMITPRTRVDLASVDYMAILFFLSILMAGILSLFPGESFNYLVYYFITFLSMIMLISCVESGNELEIFVKIIALAIFLTAIYGVYQWKVIGISVDPSQTDLTLNKDLGGRVFSTMGNSNVYGELLVLTIPFIAALFLNEKKLYLKIFWLILFAPIMLMLLKTGSRSSWIAFAISAFIFVFFWNKKLIPLLLLLGIIAVPLLPSSIYKRILTIFNSNDSSLNYRFKIMKSALAMLRDYWLAGVGLGARVVETIFQRYKAFGVTKAAHSHNLFIQIWLEAGISAVVTLLAMLIRFVKNTFIAVREKTNPAAVNILLAALSSIIGLMVMGLADHVWFYNRILYMFWIDVAIFLAALKLIRKPAENQQA